MKFLTAKLFFATFFCAMMISTVTALYHSDSQAARWVLEEINDKTPQQLEAVRTEDINQDTIKIPSIVDWPSYIQVDQQTTGYINFYRDRLSHDQMKHFNRIADYVGESQSTLTWLHYTFKIVMESTSRALHQTFQIFLHEWASKTKPVPPKTLENLLKNDILNTAQVVPHTKLFRIKKEDESTSSSS